MKRRLFLEKVSLVAGAISIPNFTMGDVLFGNSQRTNIIFHSGGKTFFDNVSLSSKNGLGSTFNLLSGLADLEDSAFDNLSVGGLDAVLFEKQAEDKIIGNKKENLPWVNSNLENKPSFIKDFLISKRLGKTTGILGIDFYADGTNVDALVKNINEKAANLKNNLNCDQIFCLINDPKANNENISFADIVQESDAIDIFFASCKISSSNRLMALKNKEGRQILLSLKSYKVSRNPEIEMGNSQIKSYRGD